MSHGLKDTGEEAIIKYFFTDEITRPSSIDIGLYNDAVDDITDAQDVDDIDTEPTGASYSRQTVQFGTAEMTSQTSGTDWGVEFDSRGFDTSDSSQIVDSYFAVINFQSEETGDSSANDHLLFTAPLDSDYDLDNLSSPTLENGGLTSN